ncbi:MAG: allantoate amidohydrolase [Actinomycetes bacterium]
MSFDSWWSEIADIGRDPKSGGYFRLVYSGPDLQLRRWFQETAAGLHLDFEADGNGNLWAWWHPELPGKALVIGSHLDSVRDGGAFDGPLGVVSAFSVIEALQASGFTPHCPIAVASFSDEEGARFGIACSGSRMMTGELTPERALALRDDEGMTMAQAIAGTLHDPRTFGPDPERLARIGHYVELHVEQGRGLIDMGAAVGVGSGIWPHGRFRFTFTGEANHAGTTRMVDRHDPMLLLARTALSANELARRLGARATLGRVQITPNSTNGIPSGIAAWVDLRAATDATLEQVLNELRLRVALDAAELEVAYEFLAESVTGPVNFDAALSDKLIKILGRDGSEVPILATGAGHDAGVLENAGIPAAMIFVRNPTGISHSPQEFAETSDCHAGVAALTKVVRTLSG